MKIKLMTLAVTLCMCSCAGRKYRASIYSVRTGNTYAIEADDSK